MSDKRTTDRPFDGENPAEERLWTILGDVPDGEPSARLRQSFYQKLEHASRPALLERLGNLLGFNGNAGWLTATACVLLGVGAGQLFGGPPDSNDRLAALEENVSILNRNLILDRLDNATASKRLRGVMDAADVVGNDSEIATALLQRATNDRVPSIRSAAISALGDQISTPAVGAQLMDLLLQTESPLVQLALVDLVLRNGTVDQLLELQKLAENEGLHPDITRHVANSLERDLV